MEEKKIKKYRMNTVGEHGTITTAIPPEVIKEQAKLRNMTPEQFSDSFYAVAHYNGDGKVEYTFEPIGGV